MDKVDLKKTLPDYQAKHGRFDIIDLPHRSYLMLDGQGDPNTSEEFKAAIETLYPLAYKLKFISKQQLGRDYTVMPLEALWWADDMTSFTSRRDKSQWRFTLMILQPEWITRELYDTALQLVATKKPTLNLIQVRFEELAEQTCMQTLHIGSFDDEAPVLAAMHDEFIPAQNLQLSGKHHEIYLSDFRRVAPDKLKTILRQPVVRN